MTNKTNAFTVLNTFADSRVKLIAGMQKAGYATVEACRPIVIEWACAKTVDWLKELGAVDTDSLVNEAQSQAARTAFTNIVTAKPAEMTHTSLANIKTPEAVQRLVGMLSAYDWEFVQQAKEIRGYTVAKLVEETEHPNANVRLKALVALGKVTEVGLFTEKIEVKKTEMSDSELETRIKEKLNRFMGVIDVIDVTEDTTDET